MEAISKPAESSTQGIEQLVRTIACRNFVAGRAELMRLGFGPTQIRSWLKCGRLTKVLHGVYSYGRDIESGDAAFRAGLIAAGPGSALTGRSACEKWGMTARRSAIPRLVEVATPTGQASTHEGKSPAMRNCRVKVVRREIGSNEIKKIDGLEVVTPMLALIDFAVDATERQVRFAFLEGCRLGLVRERDVLLFYNRLIGRRGATKVRPLLSLWVPRLNRIKSVFEGRVLLDLIGRGYPLPLVNEKIHGKEVDFFWPGKDFGLEVDGGAFHSDPVQQAIDREKQRFLEAKGLTIDRLTYKEYDADPKGKIDSIARKLGYL